jgi:hypothetical protein
LIGDGTPSCRVRIRDFATPIIAQRFRAGLPVSLRRVPQGTKKAFDFTRELLPSLTGLCALRLMFPALKRWAIFTGRAFRTACCLRSYGAPKRQALSIVETAFAMHPPTIAQRFSAGSPISFRWSPGRDERRAQSERKDPAVPDGTFPFGFKQIPALKRWAIFHGKSVPNGPGAGHLQKGLAQFDNLEKWDSLAR